MTCKFGPISIAVLDAIAHGGPMKVNQVAQELGLSGGQVGRSIWNLAGCGYLESPATETPRAPREWRATGKVPADRPPVVDLRISANPTGNAAFHAGLQEEAERRERLVQHRLAVEEDDEDLEVDEEAALPIGGAAAPIPRSGSSRFFAPQVVSGKPPIRRPGSTDFLAVPSRSGFTRP